LNVCAPALRRKNFLFVGSDAEGERAVIGYTVLGSCQLTQANPIEHLADVLPSSTSQLLLPARWKRSALPRHRGANLGPTPARLGGSGTRHRATGCRRRPNA
jgi:hypothetical protein